MRCERGWSCDAQPPGNLCDGDAARCELHEQRFQVIRARPQDVDAVAGERARDEVRPCLDPIRDDAMDGAVERLASFDDDLRRSRPLDRRAHRLQQVGEIDDSGRVSLLITAAEARINWSVHLANGKAAGPRFEASGRRNKGVPANDLIIDAKLMERFRNNFYLETMIPEYADNLKSLRGFKFDWTRNDANFDHVYSNQAFTHKLNEFGVIHEAEEYNGVFGADWGVDGRFYTDVLPFFRRSLVFDTDKESSRD
jgi:hypothetical protein